MSLVTGLLYIHPVKLYRKSMMGDHVILTSVGSLSCRVKLISNVIRDAISCLRVSYYNSCLISYQLSVINVIMY